MTCLYPIVSACDISFVATGGRNGVKRRRGEAGVSTQLGGESEGVKNSEKGSKNDQI